MAVKDGVEAGHKDEGRGSDFWPSMTLGNGGIGAGLATGLEGLAATRLTDDLPFDGHTMRPRLGVGGADVPDRRPEKGALLNEVEWMGLGSVEADFRRYEEDHGECERGSQTPRLTQPAGDNTPVSLVA